MKNIPTITINCSSSPSAIGTNFHCSNKMLESNDKSSLDNVLVDHYNVSDTSNPTYDNFQFSTHRIPSIGESQNFVQSIVNGLDASHQQAKREFQQTRVLRGEFYGMPYDDKGNLLSAIDISKKLDNYSKSKPVTNNDNIEAFKIPSDLANCETEFTKYVDNQFLSLKAKRQESQTMYKKYEPSKAKQLFTSHILPSTGDSITTQVTNVSAWKFNQEDVNSSLSNYLASSNARSLIGQGSDVTESRSSTSNIQNNTKESDKAIIPERDISNDFINKKFFGVISSGKAKCVPTTTEKELPSNKSLLEPAKIIPIKVQLDFPTYSGNILNFNQMQHNTSKLDRAASMNDIAAVIRAKAKEGCGNSVLSNITVFQFSNAGLQDNHLTEFMDALMHQTLNLDKFNFHGNHLTGKGVEYMFYNLRNTSDVAPHNIQTINLSNNNIGDDGVEYIAQSLINGRYPNLRSLDISGNDLLRESNSKIIELVKNIKQNIQILVDRVFSLSFIVEGGKKQSDLLFGSKKEKHAIIKDYIKQAQDNGIDVKNIAVSKGIFEKFKNDKALAGNFIFGYAKCYLMYEDIQSFATEKIVVKLSTKFALFKMVTDVVSCYIEAFDENASSKEGIQYMLDTGVITTTDLLGIHE